MKKRSIIGGGMALAVLPLSGAPTAWASCGQAQCSVDSDIDPAPR